MLEGSEGGPSFPVTAPENKQVRSGGRQVIIWRCSSAWAKTALHPSFWKSTFLFPWPNISYPQQQGARHLPYCGPYAGRVQARLCLGTACGSDF